MDPAQNFVENLVDGHRTLPVLLEDLRAARESIHVSIFLWFNDPIGNEVARVLMDQAQRGLSVRVLVNIEKTELGDPFSTGEEGMMEADPDFPSDALEVKKLTERMVAAGVEVLDSNLDFGREARTDDPALLEQWERIRTTSRVDALHIDHRKLVTLDGRVGYCGSANIGAQYLHWDPFDPGVEAHTEAERVRAAGGREPWWKWHDGLVRFEGPCVASMDAVFRERWILDGGGDYGRVKVLPGPSRARGIPVDAVELFKNQPDSTPNACRKLFLERIAAAERSIFIENPYVYHPEIVAALVQARSRNPGLRVDLIVPALTWNDNEYAQDAMQHHYAKLIRAGVGLFEYQNHFTHLKLATFDERISIVGSANLNFRSMENDNDFELVAEVTSEALVRQIHAEVRDVDLRYSRRLLRKDLTFSVRRRDPRTVFLVWRRLL